MIDLDLAAKVSQAFLTPVIACFGAYIAWCQFSENKEKVRLDKFDRRYKVYQAVKKFLFSVRQRSDVVPEALLEFSPGCDDAKLFFHDDQQLLGFLDNLRRVAIGVSAAKCELNDPEYNQLSEDERKKLRLEKSKNVGYLNEQDEQADRLFMPYLVLRR